MSTPNRTTPVTYREIPRFPGFRFGGDASVATRWMLGVKKQLGDEWRFLKPSPRKSGYQWFYAGSQKTTKPLRLDEVICEAFHGDRPEGTECLHRDGDRANCRSDNLYWGVDSERAIDPALEFREISELPGYRFYADGSMGSCWTTRSSEKTDVWCRVNGWHLDSGHIQVYIKCGDGTHRRYGLHHLICWAWHGPCPEGLECCHRDGVPDNNVPTNLRWGTRLSNIRDQIRHGVLPRGEQKWSAKLTEAAVIEARHRYADGESGPSLAKRYGVSNESMCDAISGSTWSHVPGAVEIRQDHGRKLTDAEIELSRAFYARGVSSTKLAAALGVSVPLVLRAIRGETGRDLPGGVEIRQDHGRKLTPDEEAELCRLCDEGTWTLRRLADKFGICEKTVANILARS